MMEDGESKVIGTLMHEEIDIMSHRLKEADFSDKRVDRIMVDVSQRMDERGNGR